MSTFDGIVKEFPDIRIDHFRQDPSLPPPLAYFVSHVHTDHLVGLEAKTCPLIYCSPATREILPKLEKYAHRMNFAEGILEKRKRTYTHLERKLRPIPLETPTEIQLSNNKILRVTLFDANHCAGAVMLLIEGDSKAILYTGDIRSEIWWVNTLLRNPILLPYVASKDQPPLRVLDCIYLDTTFATKNDPYREFPSKACGQLELLRKVSEYPKDTIFYFDSWTYGYEEVWQALSTFLEEQIHVDHYRYNVYKSLANCKGTVIPEAAKLIGVQIGNDWRKGCLTTEQSRIHSCEKGTECEIWSKQFVRITPIITRHNGMEMGEMGAGGGHGDLNQNELDLGDEHACSELMLLCYSALKDQGQLRDGVFEMLKAAKNDPGKAITLDAADMAANGDIDGTYGTSPADARQLSDVVQALAKRVARTKHSANAGRRPSAPNAASGLPQQITFPYSRHSSYSELCWLIEAFLPLDITPCTVQKVWNPDQSMEYLFGQLYKHRPSFTHDQMMLAKQQQTSTNGQSQYESQSQSQSQRETPPRETQDSDVKFEIEDLSSPIAIRSSPIVQRSSPARRPRDDDERSAQVMAKRTKLVPHDDMPHGNVPQGDFWPPLEVDHYSPPPKRRNSNIGNASENIQVAVRNRHPPEQSTSWSQPSLIERTPSPNGQASKWQRHIAESRCASSSNQGSEVENNRRRSEDDQGLPAAARSRRGSQAAQARVERSGRWRSQIQGHLLSDPRNQAYSRSKGKNKENIVPNSSEDGSPRPSSREGAARSSSARSGPCRPQPPADHGRLSAQTGLATSVFDIDENVHPERRNMLHGDGQNRLSSPPAWASSSSAPEAIKSDFMDIKDEEVDENELKLALRWQAFDAALGNNGLHWSDVGLVSVNGHQVKEEEL